MPVKLVGPRSKYIGKTLWEICGNLKDFGVGRLVVKSHFRNYPETSYYKIAKVQAVAPPADKHADRKVMVWAEHVFRGKKFPELVQMHDLTHLPTFMLVPRAEEAKYLEAPVADRTNDVAPFREFPPIMRILLEREAKTLGKPLAPMKNVVTLKRNASVRLKTDGSFAKDSPPNLSVGPPVAELLQRLEELKLANTNSSQT